MNSRGFWRRGWLTQVVAFWVLLAGVVSAHAGSINGTVTNTTTREGRVFMSLQHEFGGDTGLGASISQTSLEWPNFTIRGVPNGTYRLNAFVDGSGTGFLHANDPTWSSGGTITINNDTYSGPESAVTFAIRPNVAPAAPPMVMILPGDNGAFVGWDEPQDSNFNTIADSYKLYWSTGSNTTPKATPEGVITVPAGGQTFAVLNPANGTTLHVQVTSLVGTTESAASTVYNMLINPPGTGSSISGTITLSGISNPMGTLYLAVVDPVADGPPTAVAWVASPPQLSNIFTIHGVPDGTYSLYAMFDMDGDGSLGSGDIMLSDRQAPSITVSGADITDQTLTLTKSNSSTFLNTSHWQDTNTPPNESYQVIIGAEAMLETITNITVTGGPANNGLSYPIDLGINSWGQFQAWLNVNNNRPQLTDIYNLSIQYANDAIGPDTVNLPVTAVLDSFATPTAPVGNLPWSLVADPTDFSWNAPTGPAPLPDPYTYSFWVNAPGFDNNNNAYYQMPSSTLSVQIPGLTLNDGERYGWDISVQDSFGNQTQKTAWFAYTSSPAIDFFTPTTVLQGDTVTITGINFNTTAENNTVFFNCASATASTVNASGTELTVVVPSNTCSGSIQVNDTGTGKSSQSSMSQLNVLQTMTITGQVTDATSSNTLPASSTVTATFTLNSSTRTSSINLDGVSNNYSLPGVPWNTDFTLKFEAPGFASAYSGILNNVNWYNMALYPLASFNAWNNNDPLTGVIRGRVFDQITMEGSGFTVETAPGFTVKYDDGSGNTPGSGAFTSANGIFYVTGVTDLASVTVTATKAGYLINSVTAVGHAGAVTSVDMPAAPIISVSGTIVNSANATLVDAKIEQVGTATNYVLSTTGGAFTIGNLPGGSTFELMMSLNGYVPTYTGPLNFPSSLVLPSPVVLYTTEQFASTGITPGKGAIIGRLVNMNNPVATISGMQVSASAGGPMYTVYYFDQAYNSGAGGFNPTATATDASGMFLVMNVDDLASVNINAQNDPVNTVFGSMNLTTHANAVSEIAVPCNVPAPFGWLTSPSTITVTTTTPTPDIYAQVNMGNATSVPGPAAGLLVELGYGPLGTDPTSPSWIWKTAVYSGQNGGNHDYVTNLSVTTAGSYDYTYRVSYFGGAYVYGDLSGSNDGYSSANAGKLTVNDPTPTATTLTSTLNPSIYGQGVGFTATVSPSAATGTVQLYVDGNLVASSNVNGGSATFGPITDITVGSHSITAAYSGDSTYAVSTSAGVLQTVDAMVMIGSNGNFLTLDAAVKAALDTEILLIRDTHFQEELTVDFTLLRPSPTPFTITLNGGLGSNFSTPAVTASSVRKLTIKNGKVIVNRFVVKPD